MNIVTNEIHIPGLKHTYKFLQISDLHLFLTDKTDIPERRVAYESRGKQYIITNNVRPETYLKEYLTYCKNKNVVPVFTGDIFDVPTRANFRCFDKLIKDINDYIVLLGNHDWSFLDHFLKVTHYGKTLKKDDHHSNFARKHYMPKFLKYMSNKNLYYDARIMDDLIILSLYNGDLTFYDEQIEFVKKIISYNKPIILFIHAPFYVKENVETLFKERGIDNTLGSKHQPMDANTKRMYDLILSNAHLFKAVIGGHTHIQTFGYIEHKIPQYTAVSSYKGIVNQYIITK